MNKKPMNYSPLPSALHEPHKKVPTALIIIVVFAISAVVAGALVAVQNRSASQLQPTPTKVPLPTHTPEPDVSSDDSLDTIDLEITNTPEGSPQDTKSIESDINRL